MTDSIRPPGQPVPPGIVGSLTLDTLPGGPAELACGDRAAVGPLLQDIVRTGALATDIETFGLGELAVHLKSVQIADAVDGSRGRRVVVLDPRVPWQARAVRWAYRQVDTIVLHNSTFDAPNLYRNGLLDLRDVDKIEDTVLWARLAWPDTMVSKRLEDLAARLLGIADGSIRGLFAVNGWRSTQEGYKRADLDLPQYVVGAALDAVATARLVPLVQQAAMATLTTDHPFGTRGVVGDEALALRDREQRMNRIYLRKSCPGIKVDFDYYTRYLDTEQSAQHERESILTTAGVRPGNGQDLAEAAGKISQLHGVMTRWPKTKTGKFRMTKTDVPVLAGIWPVAKAFAEQKSIEKIMKDYLGKLNALADANGRIHPVTNLLLAAHGRSSMGSPPIQQFPDAARGMILFDHVGTSIDWSQIEPVMAANLAGDVAALAAYELRGEKFYTGVAAAAGISYKASKIVLLAQLYGEGLDKLAADLTLQTGELTTPENARELKASIFRAMPKTKQWLNQVRSISDRYRKVPTLSGRIVSVPMGVWMGQPGVQTHKGINYIVSGSAYDLLADSVIRCEDAGLADSIIFTMHDEIVVDDDDPATALDIQRIMATPPQRMIDICKRVPVLRTDLAVMGERWKVV